MILTQVFQASGTGKNGKPYTRWDYKTADGQRFAHFAATQEIPLNTEVTLELSPSGSVRGWQAVNGATQPVAQPVQNEQSKQEAPASSRDAQIHRQTAAKVAAKLLDFFPPEEQELDTFWVVADQLCDYFANGAPSGDQVKF